MSIVLFDTSERSRLYPLTYTRAVGAIRIGILTLQEWWQKLADDEVFLQTEDYLSSLYPSIPAGEHLYIDASVLPSPELIEQLGKLQPGAQVTDEEGGVVAYRGRPGGEIAGSVNARRLRYPWQIFQWNDELLREQFRHFSKDKFGVQTSESTHVINASEVFIEEGAVMEHAVLNASTGPIYIGKNVTIMEGAFIRGPFAVGEGSVVKMGTRIYGATTAGPYCVLGGEIRNAVFQGYSNKAHDGYLGNAVIGEWCNLGAGTSNSNIKNTASEICMWDFEKKSNEIVGQKCGVIMGDYTRTAINSSVNTGSLYGVCCNVFGEFLLPRHLPNFSWGTSDTSNYRLDKALKDIDNWKKLKGSEVSPAEQKMIAYIFDHFKA